MKVETATAEFAFEAGLVWIDFPAVAGTQLVICGIDVHDDVIDTQENVSVIECQVQNVLTNDTVAPLLHVVEIGSTKELIQVISKRYHAHAFEWPSPPIDEDEDDGVYDLIIGKGLGLRVSYDNGRQFGDPIMHVHFRRRLF